MATLINTAPAQMSPIITAGAWAHPTSPDVPPTPPVGGDFILGTSKLGEGKLK